MVTVPKAALEHPIPHQPVLLLRTSFQHSTSPCWLLYHLEKKLLSMHSRNLLDCLCPDVLSFKRILGSLKSPTKWGCSYLSMEGLIHAIFLVRWPIADPYYNDLLLILAHKLWAGSSFTPRQSSMLSSWSLTRRVTHPPHLPWLHFKSYWSELSIKFSRKLKKAFWTHLSHSEKWYIACFSKCHISAKYS